MKKLTILLSFFISLLLVTLIFQIVTPNEKSKSSDDYKVSTTKDDIKEANRKLECIKKYPNVSSKEHKECILKQNPSFLNHIAIYKYLIHNKKSPDFVIKLIYSLIFIALWMQTTLLLFSLCFKNTNYINKYKFHIVDTALNSPPILGVIGTIYSFAVYTTQLENNSDLIEGFKNSFFDAAFTTIIAGFIYVINLYFKIIILKESENGKR